MGAYHWLKGIAGLWGAWLLISVLNMFTGYMWGTITYVRGVINSTISFPRGIASSMDLIYKWFSSIWNFIALVVFGAFIFYMYINSMRRDVEDYYV